jgi:3-oxoadipate enol-lactonase
MWVDRVGSGPAIVFIHGLTTDHTLFGAQREPFSKSYTFIAYDVRGYGKSERAYEPPYGLDVQVADLRALLPALGFDRAILVGFSMGGIISQQFAVRYPDMVDALVIVDAAAQFSPESRAMFAERARTAESQGMAPLADGMLSRWFTPEFHAKNPARIAAFREQILANDPATVAATCRMGATVNLLDQIPAIRAPTLVLVGEHDKGNPLPKAREIQERIAGAELAVIPGAAHNGPVEQPETFNRLVFDFLDRVGRSKR